MYVLLRVVVVLFVCVVVLLYVCVVKCCIFLCMCFMAAYSCYLELLSTFRISILSCDLLLLCSIVFLSSSRIQRPL